MFKRSNPLPSLQDYFQGFILIIIDAYRWILCVKKENKVSDSMDLRPQQAMQVITIEELEVVVTEFSKDCCNNQTELNPQDGWLPITESRKGNVYSSSFHILCSGICMQALVLPFAFTSLGWTWGIICLSMAFLWQLYTIWLLVHLHESTTISGARYSRYLHLAIASFGEKMGKLLCIFPVMYLSGGTCAMLIITGGGTMKLFLQTVSGDGSSPLNGALCFLLFTCIAIAVAQLLPNLNSIAGVSLVGAITAVCYCTLIWILSIYKGRPGGVSYDPPLSATESEGARICGILNALGLIALAFRGHNLVLEIQGTMPSCAEHPSNKPMWRGVTTSYLVIAIILFPLAIGGYWTYGNKMPANGGMLGAFAQFHGQTTTKFVTGIIYFIVLINCLSTFQIYAMPVFDNLESIYTRKKNKRCPSWLRPCLRVFFGGVAFFVAVAFPFLGGLAPLIGGITSPITFAYPCFMWIAMKRPRQYGAMWCLNVGLGCSGLLLGVVLVGAAIWNLVNKGLHANFFNP